MVDIEKQIIDCSILIKNNIEQLLSGKETRLLSAMRYSSISEGKFLRPFLLIESARVFNKDVSNFINAASALEIVHCYSLIHDDLPAMDNDDLRRGKPSCHKQYDEATAILAGDSLLTFAFEILSSPTLHENSEIRCKIIHLLATSIGKNGMAGGQMLDLQYEKKEVTKEEIINMQKMKTAFLFSVSTEIGAMLAQATNDELQAIRNYGLNLGLAFQIIDDLLDVTGIEQKAGKKLGKDENAGKATLVSKYGVAYAQEQAIFYIDQAKTHLDEIGHRNISVLSQLADFTLRRCH